MVNYFHLFDAGVQYHFFVLVCFNIYVICSSGISLLTSKFTMAYGLAVLYPVQVFFVCCLGSFARHQHEKLTSILWKFKWYQLPKNMHKDYLIFLSSVQTPMKIEPLFIGVIDMELYTNVGIAIVESIFG
jgi:hypothetical protein